MPKFNENRISGVLFILVFVTILLSGIFASMEVSLTFSSNGIENTLRAVAANKTMHLASITCDFLSFIFTVLLAGALFKVFEKHHRLLSMFGAFCLVAAGIILAYHDIGNFILPTIAEDFVSSSGVKSATIAASAKVILLSEIWGVKVGYTFFALGTFFFNLIILIRIKNYKAAAYLGIIASAATVLVSFIPLENSFKDIISFAAFLPMMVWEVWLGILLLRQTKGDSNESLNHL